MIEYNLDTANSILYMRPQSAFTAEDFANIARAVDPHIEVTGGLAGVIIEAPEFPGWDSFAALVAHFRLIHDHHRYVKKIAVVTDSALIKVIESLASHFVSAEVRRFPSGEVEAANQWVFGGS